MKKYLPVSIIFALIVLGASAVFGQELEPTPEPTPAPLTIADVETALDNYFFNKKEEEYAAIFTSETDGMKHREQLENFFNRTEAENLDYIFGKLEFIQDQINQLSQKCS